MAERRCHQQYTGSVSRRQVLGLLVGGAACACCGSVHAQKLAYDLSATEIASGTWAVHGSTEYFTLENGGNILNVAFVEVPDGVVVIDTGPSKRYGEALPGHGLQDTTGDSLEQTGDYLAWLQRTLKDAASLGLTMNEAMAQPIPPTVPID